MPPTPTDPPPDPPAYAIAGIPVRVDPAVIGCALIWQYSTGGRVFAYGTTARGLEELVGEGGETRGERA